VALKEEENKMIFEVITSTIFGGISLKAYLSKNGEGNDSKKIQKIFTLTGLNVKDGKEH
jgi:S-DNA-T family DNA segregation ATPase FtsK/SpoIIIE